MDINQIREKINEEIVKIGELNKYIINLSDWIISVMSKQEINDFLTTLFESNSDDDVYGYDFDFDYTYDKMREKINKWITKMNAEELNNFFAKLSRWIVSTIHPELINDILTKLFESDSDSDSELDFDSELEIDSEFEFDSETDDFNMNLTLGAA